MSRWVFVVVLVLATRRADADCALPATACEAAQRAKVVFAGTVTKVVRFPRGVEATMTVDESFVGSVARSVAIRSEGIDAYGNFTTGDKLLVYASQAADGTLRMSGCSRTGPVALRGSDLVELRDAVKRGVGRITGVVAADGAPRSNIEVRASNRSTFTNARGEYTLELPPGTHVVEPAKDPLLALRANPPLELRLAGCVKQDFYDKSNGRISGRLVDLDGKPVANAIVRAFPSGTVVPAIIERHATWLIGASARSNANGEYTIGPLPPAAYHVAVGAPFEEASPYPPTYHAAKGAPLDIVLGRGAAVTGVDLVVPPRLKLFKITGRVQLRGTLPTTGLVATLVETRTGRRQQAHITTVAELTEVAGGVVELEVCANVLECVKSKPLRLDRDLTIDLALEVR